MTKDKMQVECSVCRDWRDNYGKFYTPTSHQRREYWFTHQKRISHGYCSVCAELQQLKNDGLLKLINEK
jgi:hypothetical protein